MSIATTWAYSGTGVERDTASHRLRRYVANASPTQPSSLTAMRGARGVVHSRWEILEASTQSEKMSEAMLIREPALLWLVWSGGSHEKQVNTIAVGIAPATPRAAKYEAARKTLREWLRVSDEERAEQDKKLAVLMADLNQDRLGSRKLFR